MAAKLSVTLYQTSYQIFYGLNLPKIYQEWWLLDIKSCYVSEITLVPINKKYFDRSTNGTFWGQIQFLVLFCPDRYTLKFLRMKCNATNKKTVV